MEAKYGKREARIRVNFMYMFNLIGTGIALLIIGGAIIPMTTISNPWVSRGVVIVSILILIYALVITFMNNVSCYDKAIVITEIPKKARVIKLEDIAIIHWDRAGASEVNSRGIRKNTTIAEVILKNSELIKITTGVYTGVERKLGDFQSKHNIPQEY